MSHRDYRAVSKLMTVPKCARDICERISIVKDLSLEDTESFNIYVNRTAGLDLRIILDRVTAIVTITDDDSKTILVSHSLTMSATITTCTASICLLSSRCCGGSTECKYESARKQRCSVSMYPSEVSQCEMPSDGTFQNTTQYRRK